MVDRCLPGTSRRQYNIAPGYYIRPLKAGQTSILIWPPRYLANEKPPRYLPERSASSARAPCSCQFVNSNVTSCLEAAVCSAASFFFVCKEADTSAVLWWLLSCTASQIFILIEPFCFRLARFLKFGHCCFVYFLEHLPGLYC